MDFGELTKNEKAYTPSPCVEAYAQVCISGICTVLHGQNYLGLFSEPTAMNSILSSFFKLTPSQSVDELTMAGFVDKKTMLILDVHNMAIVKSEGKGKVTMQVGSREAFVNQVRDSRFHRMDQDISRNNIPGCIPDPRSRDNHRPRHCG